MTERTVNARQLDVLRWIVDGCPDGVMEGFTYKSTALALQGRRLVTVTKRRGQWKAVATEAGVYFLKHGVYPSGHWTASSVPRPTRPAPVRSRPQTRPKVERTVTGRRPVDQMLADLVDAGGELVVQSSEHGYWEGLVSSATRYNKVPDGKLLKIERGKTSDERIIRLADPPKWMSAVLEPVPVKGQLRNPHPAVKTLWTERDHLMLRREVNARALRILDAIANACAARGYEADLPQQRSGDRHVNGHLQLTINGHPNVIKLDELNDRVPHEPTRQELRDKERHSWTRIPTHDQVPSGRLRLKLLNGWAIRQDTFSDTKTITLEDRLPVVLQELELRAAAAEERDQQRERERQERHRRWDQVRAQAEAKVREQHRVQTLTRQVEQWEQANRLDRYLNAMEQRIGELDGDEKAAATAWLTWATAYLQRLDPLGQALRIPADPEFTPDAIAPFMRGMSPYGPPNW